MQKTKLILLILLGLLTVSVFGVLGSAPASAAETIGFWDCQNVGVGTGHWKDSQCKKEPGSGNFNTEEIAETQAETTQTETSELVSKLVGVTVVIMCAKNSFVTLIKTGGASTKGAIRFGECTLFTESEGKRQKRPECRVKLPSEFKFKDQLVETSKQAFSDRLVPSEGTTFVEIVIENKSESEICPLKSTNKVTGIQSCPIPKAEEALVAHEIACAPKGSELKFGSEPAEFTSINKVFLQGAGPWGAA